MDHRAFGAMDGLEGVLWKIEANGTTTEVVADLAMGTPGGVSTTAGGAYAVMPTRDATGAGRLTIVQFSGGVRTELPAPMIKDPAGIRVARQAGVFAVVDSEGGAIFRAE